MQYVRKVGCGPKRCSSRKAMPFVQQRLLVDLKRLGYREASLPKPLQAAANDVASFALAAGASAVAPLALGGAQILAIGRHHGDHVIVRIPGHGDYRGRLFHDLFFAGSGMSYKGRLLFAGAFYVFCSFDCTTAQAAEALREIHTSRDTISDRPSSLRDTQRRHLLALRRRCRASPSAR